MAHERGSALVATTAVVMMVTIMAMHFHCDVAEAAKVADTTVIWYKDNVFQAYPGGQLAVPKNSTLVFVYKSGDRNVVEVTGGNFTNCNGEYGIPFPFEGDTVKKGTHYYLSSKGTQCSELGMKIQINAR